MNGTVEKTKTVFSYHTRYPGHNILTILKYQLFNVISELDLMLQSLTTLRRTAVKQLQDRTKKRDLTLGGKSTINL